MDFLLKNGKIYDGTGADAFLGDILVRGDRIEKIGEGLICDGDRSSGTIRVLRVYGRSLTQRLVRYPQRSPAVF